MRKLAFVLSCFVLSAASVTIRPSHADDGALLGAGLGAAIGGLLGSEMGHGHGHAAATGFGIITGGIIGAGIGDAIDRDARPRTYAYPQFAPQPSYYPPIVYYTYRPTYVAPPPPPVQYEIYIDHRAGTYCRTYSEEIIVDGIPRESFGTACLQPDGTWRTVQ